MNSSGYDARRERPVETSQPKPPGAFRWILLFASLTLAQTGVIAWLWTRLPEGGVLTQAGGVFHRPDPNLIQTVYPDVDFTRVYPDLEPAEIDELQRTSWGLRYGYEPFVQFRPFAVRQKFIEITPAGFRRGRVPAEPWPPRADEFVVFVFGGSTTFGYGLPGEQTVVQYLEQELAALYPEEVVQAYNFGRGYYFSTQERILFESLLLEGFVPDLVLFIDGLNDFYYHDGIPEYTGNLAQSVTPDQPMQHRPRLNKEQYPSAVQKVLARYARNLRMSAALADEFGIPVIFVAQPVPFLHYPVGPQTYPYQRFFDGHALCMWGYGAFEKAAQSGRFGGRFLWCGDALAAAESIMYVDCVHYAAEGAAQFAQTMASRAAEEGLLPVR